MVKWAIILFIAAIVLAAVGFGGLGAIAWQIAVVLAVIAAVLFVWHLISGRSV